MSKVLMFGDSHLKETPEGSRVIYLTKNRVALVDEEDYSRLSGYKFFAHKNKNSKSWYAGTRVYRGVRNGKLYKMHRMVLGVVDSKIKVDHINSNGLDNRKLNLRLCSDAENSRNLGLFKSNTSGYKGVHKASKGTKGKKRVKCWVARIKVAYKEVLLGYFLTPEEAALAYNEAAKKYHGKFAKLNEIKANT